ncbi:hypothetical protein ANO11243_041810 [Dothideomycetidae sp. 11243]|nr:hypothetical protein ANO11243_041810 [fungal sp. No.11243]
MTSRDEALGVEERWVDKRHSEPGRQAGESGYDCYNTPAWYDEVVVRAIAAAELCSILNRHILPSKHEDRIGVLVDIVEENIRQTRWSILGRQGEQLL